MLSRQEYNSMLKLLQSCNLTNKKKIHIIGELKRITDFKKRKIIF